MTVNIFDWFHRLRYVVRSYVTDMRELRTRMNELNKLVRDRTDIAVDVRFREPNYVIVIGRYGKTDYVQTYSVRSDDLGYLIDMLTKMQRHAQVRIVDGPPEVKAAIKSFVL
jgi:hypothetical protein